MAGSGLGRLGAEGEGRRVLSVAAIPHFPCSTVPGHAGELVRARLGGREVVVLRGRCHLYEGYTAREVAFPLRTLFHCGVKGLILTNAAGGLDLSYRVGDLMLLADHINATGTSCLEGPHDERLGPRFPDLSRAYDAELRALARRAAARLDIPLREGVYLAVRGPNYETPAETRAFRQAGADAIGMSTVQETLAAVQAGVRVLAVSCITNVNNPANQVPSTHADVLAAAGRGAANLTRLLEEVCAQWPA